MPDEYIMVDIFLIEPGHPLWRETISFAETCSWRAGPVLAKKMKNREFRERERVCVSCINGNVAGFCTFTEKDELPARYEFTPFIGFVFVGAPYRGNRLSQQMIQKIISYAYGLGFEQIYILSGEMGLYEKYGFQKLGDYETIYGTTDQLFVKSLSGSGPDIAVHTM